MNPIIADRVKLAITNHLCMDYHKLNIDTKLEHEGMDSLDAIEITLKLEEAFNIEISDEDMEKLETTRQVIEYIARRLK